MDDITPQKTTSSDNTNTAPIMPEETTQIPVQTDQVVEPASPAATETEVPVAVQADTPVAQDGMATAPEQTSDPLDEAANPEAVVTAAPVAADAMKKKSALPFIMLIVALVVLGLGAAAYFALVKSEDKAVVPVTQTQAVETETEVDPDEVSGNIDESMKAIDDDKDYSETDLNDESLNL